MIAGIIKSSTNSDIKQNTNFEVQGLLSLELVASPACPQRLKPWIFVSGAFFFLRHMRA